MPGVKGTLEEFKRGELHSGSKQGPVVTSRKQAIAIGLNEERKGKGSSKRKKFAGGYPDGSKRG